MMTKDELTYHLRLLDINATEAAQFLGVSSRTIKRWFEGEEVPGPAEAALRAWARLAERNLAWKPDSASIFDDDQDQIERQRKHTLELITLLERVEARGGASTIWNVDIPAGTATFGPFEVAFYKLANGSFSLGHYRRKDIPPDSKQDLPLLEDAIYCIAQEIAKCRACSTTLRTAAEYVRHNSEIFVTSGKSSLSSDEKLAREFSIDVLSDAIDKLASDALEGKASYRQFELILEELRTLGFFIELSLISAVAQAFLAKPSLPIIV